MKFYKPHTLKELRSIIEIQEVVGDENYAAKGVNEIHKVEEGDITFVDHPKYYSKSLNSAASVVLINTLEVENPANKILVLTDDPFVAYNKLAAHFIPFRHTNAQISETARIHPSAHIFPNVFVGANVRIGENAIIYPNTVVMDQTVIGDRVIIHGNTTIGGDAFYYQKRENGYNKMNSCGRVVIENDVEIGSNCTIDRGVSGDTIIGEGSKLDNQVHLGHGVVLGKECLLAAQVGIAGKTVLGDGVIVWGQAGITKSIHIGDGAIISAKAGVSKSLEGGKHYFGSPARPIREVYKEMAILKRLPDWWRKQKGKS